MVALLWAVFVTGAGAVVGAFGTIKTSLFGIKESSVLTGTLTEDDMPTAEGGVLGGAGRGGDDATDVAGVGVFAVEAVTAVGARGGGVVVVGAVGGATVAGDVGAAPEEGLKGVIVAVLV